MGDGPSPRHQNPASPDGIFAQIRFDDSSSHAHASGNAVRLPASAVTPHFTETEDMQCIV